MNLEKFLINKFKDKIVNINSKNYVSIDLLTESMYNIALNDAILGILALKLGTIEIKEDDIINYMNEYTNNIEVKFDNNKYVIKRK